MKAIAKALIEARSNMGKLYKDKKNPHFKSDYATLKAVIETAEGPLMAAGIAVIERLETTEAMKVVAHCNLFHAESGEEIPSNMVIGEAGGNPQQMGSAQTYARRQMWTAASGLAPEDDDGNAAAQAAQKAPPVEKVEEDPELDQKRAYWAELCSKLKEAGHTGFPAQMEWITAQKGFKTISEPGELTCKQYPKLIKLAEDEDLPFADETTKGE